MNSGNSAKDFDTKTGFSEVGHVLNELFMKYNDDLGGSVQGAIYDADAAFEKLEKLRDWTDRHANFPKAGTTHGHDLARQEVAAILEGRF